MEPIRGRACARLKRASGGRWWRAIGAAGLLAAVGAGAASGFEPGELAVAAPVAGVTAPGLYRIEIEPDVYHHTRSTAAPLGDLRIAGPDGEEVPYLLRAVGGGRRHGSTAPRDGAPDGHEIDRVDDAPRRRLPVRLDRVPRRAGDTATVFDIDLAAAGVPIDAVLLAVTTPVFDRSAAVAASDAPPAFSPVGSGRLSRAAAAEDGAPGEEHLALPAGGTRRRYLRVTIDDGGAAPLAIRGASVEYAPEEILFRADVAGGHTLYLGADALAPPRHDPRRVLGDGDAPDEVRVATLGPLVTNPLFGQPPRAAPATPPAPGDGRRALLPLLALLFVGVGALVVRALRRA